MKQTNTAIDELVRIKKDAQDTVSALYGEISHQETIVRTCVTRIENAGAALARVTDARGVEHADPRAILKHVRTLTAARNEIARLKRTVQCVEDLAAAETTTRDESARSRARGGV